MNRWIRIGSFLCLTAAALAFVALPGCKNNSTPAKEKEKGKEKEKEKEKDKGDGHDHGEVGPHGGPLAEWDDIYHLEFTVDSASTQTTIYLLDDKAKAAPKIDPDKITEVVLTITSVKPAISIDLKHDPKLSGDKGIAFVGTHEQFAKPDSLKGNIKGKVDGKKYTGDFTYEAKKAKGVASIRELYLKPGGFYTAADIKANGTMTATEKFEGKEWPHEKMKLGDKICPISKSKAEAECGWFVQGQRYEFCCPPCVDKFVRMAHEKSDKIKDADQYIYKGM